MIKEIQPSQEPQKDKETPKQKYKYQYIANDGTVHRFVTREELIEFRKDEKDK